MTVPLKPLDANSSPIEAFRPSEVFNIDGTSASAQTEEFATETLVRITSESDINIAFGVDPTASSSTLFLPTPVVEYFKVHKGDKIAVLGGVANISVMR